MSIKSKIQALISAGNATTGEADTDLTSVMQTLIDGYGGAGTKYAIRYELTNVTSSNNSIKAKEGSPYNTTLTPSTGLTIDSVIVMMNGVNVTSTVYSNGTVNIASVTGAIIIMASAMESVDTITINDVDSSFRTKVQEVVADVNETSANSISFVVLTDTHGSANGQKSQNVVRYLLKNSRANKLFWLGDISNVNWSTSEYETFREPLLNCAEKVYPTIGNHEYFGNANGTGLSEIYDDFLADKILQGSPSNFYFYFDDTSRKVRYIFINTSDGATDKVTATQKSWLASAVQVADSSWKIIVFSHYPFNTSVAYEKSSASIELRDILLSTNGTIISHICGHGHRDFSAVIDYSFYEQVLLNDSASGQAISVVSINLDTGSVNITRIGSGSDIEYTYTELPEMVSRTITNTLTGCSNSNSATSIINGRPYSATLVADANYDLDLGTVEVTMGGIDVTSTVYNSSTHAINIDSVTGNIAITASAVYVEPLEEFTANWLVKNTAKAYPYFSFTSASDASSNFPNYLSFVMCNQGSAYPDGYRVNSYARYRTRTSGWTQHPWYFVTGTGTNNIASLITNTWVNGKNYAYVTFTKADSDIAYTAYQTAINNGEIDTSANQVCIEILQNKASSLDANFEYWVLDVNVDASNIDSIVSRLPVHETAEE